MPTAAKPSRAVRLFGTEEAVEPPMMLRAGPLSAELEAGNLRYIRYAGFEMLRAVSYIVRDRNWATYNPEISNLQVEQTSDRFRVTYDAVTSDAAQSFAYSAEITSHADGALRFAARANAMTDFVTNRCGFVVLHPIEGVAGRPVTIEHVDGRIVEGGFPALVDPVQPMMDLRALTHEFAPGARVTCRMEGDTFEMEDQRNWTDASYKTYVRPLALRWPYTLATGAKLDQEVSLSVSGRPAGEAPSANAPVTVGIDGAAGTMPPIGIGLDPDEHDDALAHADKLRALGVAHVVCHYDPRRGHDPATLAKAVDVARAIGGEPWLEAVIAKIEGWGEEVAALGAAVQAIGSPFATVLISPAPDLKCTLPGSVWPPCPPAEALFRAARATFPGTRLGGGMFSYFTELNRKRPPLEDLDLVSFTTCPIVHAGDDRTVMENLESLPAIAASVRAFIGDKPFHVGPSAIGMRANPYGAAPMENPNGIRQAMSRADPRQRGVLNAAWTVGHVARFAAGGASALTLGGAVGPAGVLHVRADYPQPFFDTADGGLYPAFHVLRGLAALKGATRLGCAISRPHDLQALAVTRDGRTVLWLGNLTTDALTVRIATPGAARVAMLSETNFPEAAATNDALDRAETAFLGGDVLLRPLAAARLRFK